jgi:hypothetical protein
MSNDQADPARLRLTFYIALAGIGAVLLAFVASLLAFYNVSNPGEVIPAVIGPITAVVGTLAGYVAGQTAGAAGKEKAEQRAETATADAARAEKQLGFLFGLGSKDTGEDLMDQARERFPEWFPPTQDAGS